MKVSTSFQEPTFPLFSLLLFSLLYFLGFYLFLSFLNFTKFNNHFCFCFSSGTFGQVLECLDSEKKEVVAIKIVRSISKYREAAMIEIDVLQRLARHDIGGTR